MKHLFLALSIILFSVDGGTAQQRKQTKSFPEITSGLEYRNIGPSRGGRSAAVTGVPGQPMTFYFGSTGGGVWKTKNGGSTWENVSDGYFGGSIGSIQVSESNPNVIYVGGGEVTVRGNVSYGYGVYRSDDGGRSWEYKGLPNSRHIPRIRIHPDNPNIVYAAVLGDLYKSNEERGVYKSTDGGDTWKKVLFSNADAGAVDIVMDPQSPRILYASTWNVRRTPYSLISGGAGSALWKSTDAGENWKKISDSEGFPEDTLGIIGVTVSPANPERVWAIVEAAEGGVYRSDDGGKNWSKVNDDRSLRQRAWYYSRIYADPVDVNTVYVMNVAYHKSTDGGKSFKSAYAPHGDHHDLWIAPEDPQRMIIGDDGGAQVTYDGGDSWSTYKNQPTAQFYRVTTDNSFPYRIYGAQQDNSTVRIRNVKERGRYDWESTAGGESAHIAIDPDNNDIVYGGSYGGYLTRKNHETGQSRAINVWPDNPMGYGAEGMKYRFQWNFPVFFSPHNNDKLYTASNHLHVSTNEGETWEVISPDLTRNDPSKLGPSGGPITKDNTGVEYYGTIFAAIESPYEKDLLWTGSDDGLIHVSKDAGANWENVTPKGMPEWIMINSIEADPFNKGGLFVAATMYKWGDYKPYLYHTTDYGKSWTKIVDGIDPGHFTRVVRADPERKGLLYCGTESGMYVSYNNGGEWEPFQLNLPVVPITDLTIKYNDLIVATQGRSFWILDDLHILRQASKEVTSTESYLFDTHPTFNTIEDVRVHYYFDEKPSKEDTVTLRFLDKEKNIIRTFSTHPGDKQGKFEPEDSTGTFTWDTRYPKADDFDGMLLWWGTIEGPKAAPGDYFVRFIVNGDSTEKALRIERDPRAEGSVDDLNKRFEFLLDIRNTLDATHDAIRNMRELKAQIASLNDRLKEDEHGEVIDEGKRLDSVMTSVEKKLYQTKLKSNQDMLNFPIKLNNKLAHLASLASMGNDRPTDQMIAFKEEITKEINKLLEQWETIKTKELPAYNDLIRQKEIDLIGF